jgi:hypothetical protein
MAPDRATGQDRRATAPAWSKAEADEWDELATALDRFGIKHIAPTRPRAAGVPETPRELFHRLALTEDPRLKEASIVLLLTHPNLTADARAAIDSIDGPPRDRAMRRYVAAAALQRMARTRISLTLGPQPEIPSAYLDELGLPPLEEDFGRVTLLALAEAEEARYGYVAWRGYLALLDAFLSNICRRDWGRMCVHPSTERA